MCWCALVWARVAARVLPLRQAGAAAARSKGPSSGDDTARAARGTNVCGSPYVP